MVVVKLENLSKKFRDVIAVDNLNLEIKDKEFFVFLGPSGSGKSTTLNMIAGLEEPTSGYIYFDGQIVNDIPPEKRDVAMVFQTFALYPHLNAFENIAFPLKVRKYPKDEIKNKVYEIVKEKERGTYLAEISRLTGYNRHTVKKALLVLAKEGKIVLQKRGNLIYAYAGGEKG